MKRLAALLLALSIALALAFPAFGAGSSVFDIRTYGAKCDGVTDDATAIQAALTAAGALTNGGTVQVPAGDCMVKAALTKAANVRLIGAGMFASILRCDGAHHCIREDDAGPSYTNDGSIEELKLIGQNGALKGITVNYRREFLARRLRFEGFTEQAIYLNHTTLGKIEQSQFSGNGSATYGQVEVDNSTTFMWHHSYISGSSGGGTVAGLLIDRTQSVDIIGGAIESTGVPIKVGSKAEATTGCASGLILGTDFENPGNGNMFVDIGAGLSGAARVTAWDIRGVSGSPAGTTSIPYAIRFNQASAITVEATNFGQAGVPTATFELTGLTNLGVSISAHRNLYGNTFPWVRRNGAQVKAAGPYHDWNSETVPIGLRGANPALTGATPSILILASQGGFYSQLYTNNVGATTVTALTGGERGMEIVIVANDANTTLTHSTVTADQFNLTGGANLLLTNGKAYKFFHNGTLWVQM